MEAEITQTQSTETYYRVLAWLHANRKRLLIGLGVVAALGLIAGFAALNKARSAADANARLFELPVASAPNMPVLPPPPSAYLDLASKYPDTSAGEYAVLLGAESLFVEGNYPQAQQEFSKFIEEHPESPLVAQAKVGVAACLEAEGKNSDAIQKYQQIVSTYPSDASVSEPAKLTMARLYEQENRPDQALNFYSELARSQNPYDPWAAEARDRGALLLAKHPELRRTEAAPAPAAPFSIAPPVNTPAVAPPATTPAPQTKSASPTLNLLNFPAASSNTPAKP
jgi:predicted negative regulator of RcsB-dependent stress response